MILIVDNYDSFTYNLFQIVAQIVPDVEVVRNDKITISEIRALNPKGIILTPGPGRPENAGVCVELVKTFFQDIPILGVCLGQQAIAYAFGGRVVNANEIVHGKSDMIFHHRKSIYKNVPLPFEAARYHSLVVEKESFPEELQINSENNNGMIMGIEHKVFPTYGVQFHPESILSPHGPVIMQNFINTCV